MNRHTLETMKVYYSTFDAGSWIQAPRDGVLDLIDSLERAWRRIDEAERQNHDLTIERDALLRGEYICRKCGLRKDEETRGPESPF